MSRMILQVAQMLGDGTFDDLEGEVWRWTEEDESSFDTDIYGDKGLCDVR